MSEEKKEVTFHYFGVKARGFPAVVGGAYWGKELVWEKYSFDDWKNNKNEIKSHCSFGQLPVLHDNGSWLPQSMAIVRYLGKKWKKEGSSMEDFLLSETLIEESKDILNLLVEAKYGGKNTPAAWDTALSKMPKHLENLQKLMTGTRFASEVLMGDMAIFGSINMVLDNNPHILDNYTNLKTWYDGIASKDAVKAVLNSSTIYLKKPDGSSSNKDFKSQIREVKKGIAEFNEKRKRLRKLDLFVLDNSLRETTVGQLRGHTIDNKWKIFNEVKKCKFEHVIVASFSHSTRLGDTFIQQLKDRGENFEYKYAFTEFIETYKDRIPQDDVPIGLIKMRDLGIKNVVMEMDLVYHGIDYKQFGVNQIIELLDKRFKWIRENLSHDSRIFVNLRDLPDCMKKKPARLFKVVNWISSLPKDQQIFGIVYEESGKYFPEELGVWTRAVRNEMDRCGFEQGHLLVHVHQQWGIVDMTQLECLANGADGIWAGLCEEGAAMGHASSCLTALNLVRMGNQKVLRKYNCQAMREAAINVTKITTGLPPHPKQAVYGARALDIVFGMDQFTPNKKEFSLAEFVGEKPVMRITTLSSPQMIVDRLVNLFGTDPQFNLDMAKKMLAKMLEDLHANIKEEYHSIVGLVMLFDRSGGNLTGKMSEAIEEMQVKHAHIKDLIQECREMWDEWDCREEKKRDDFLSFDAFYNGFMAPYFGCYRCDETKKALSAIDMDNDGRVDWNEFAVYLKWAGRQYPQDITTAAELLDITFRKGLVPAMQDEVLKTIQPDDDDDKIWDSDEDNYEYPDSDDDWEC